MFLQKQKRRMKKIVRHQEVKIQLMITILYQHLQIQVDISQLSSTENLEGHYNILITRKSRNTLQKLIESTVLEFAANS